MTDWRYGATGLTHTVDSSQSLHFQGRSQPPIEAVIGDSAVLFKAFLIYDLQILL